METPLNSDGVPVWRVAKKLGWHHNTVLKYIRLGKIRAKRSSNAKQAPWLCNRDDVNKYASHA